MVNEAFDEFKRNRGGRGVHSDEVKCDPLLPFTDTFSLQLLPIDLL